MAFRLKQRWTKWCDTIRCLKKVPYGHLHNNQHSVRWDMRPRAFVVPFKETTIGGRSRAIGLRSDQPLGCTHANMIQLISRRLSTTIAPSPNFRETDLQKLQEVINNFLSSMAMCLSCRATHMILSFDQSERKQSSNSNSPTLLLQTRLCSISSDG